MTYLQYCVATFLLLPAAVVLVHILVYLVDPYGLRQHPGPFWAKFSSAWLGWVAKQGHRSEVIHELHRIYGPIVRISPAEVSIADADAFAVVYGHGNGALKSSLYDEFVSIDCSMFNTRDRAQHARKRKIVSHAFSHKSVLELETHIRRHIALLLVQWDRLYDGAVKGMSGSEGEGGWSGHNGRLWLNCFPWMNYLAFDTIGDLALGTSFGMITSAHDAAPIPAKSTSFTDLEFANPEVTHIPAIAVLNGRGEYAAAMGVLPAWLRPFAAQLPWYRARAQSTPELTGMAIVAVSKRLAVPVDRVDLLSQLQLGSDDRGELLDRKELTVEAQSFILAGSDTTANSITAIIHHIAANPSVQSRLQQELDEYVCTVDEPTATYEQIKHLPYLEACINEGMRVHSTVGLGLPRIVPEGGLTICGHFFPARSVVGVPAYTVHRDPEIWGHDADVFRPERWLDANDKLPAMLKAFNPFSTGSRGCVGRNLASLELTLFAATLFRRYRFVLAEPEKSIETCEGFIRKPVRCDVGIKRRDS
ncbi:cytochrome P450 monooxygenase [Favolaschia claudopus]|uniref:Cytochrome P450 monooxygenase n=1 Tax=Favolaschia claudopus TaxID=2862362 RepID=A0AAW0D2I5_9AGAR